VPSLSNTAILSATGIKDELAVSVTALTHWVMRCAVASFQEGRTATGVCVSIVGVVVLLLSVLQLEKDKTKKSRRATCDILIIVMDFLNAKAGVYPCL
jgi:hypothetical protein